MELTDLTKKRQEHIQSCRENNDNSHKIIAGLYSDPSHFIYELLQNSDDAKASEVIFNLSANSLEIKHNGSKLFDFNDVDSITTVGSSTKVDDINSIGTFGAGFKSVFAITKTPNIHSGAYHFRVVDFIVPETIEPLDHDKNYTVIVLPFNHPEITAEETYTQISNRLRSLESESLLFLRNIREIQWHTESDKGHYLSEINNDKASLISQINDQDASKDFILLNKIIEIDDSELNISVAYPLDTSENNKITPVHESKLFVFFPTNERTGLNFLVHAPYKTTPSRESIPFEDDQNQAITDELSQLISESISIVKDKGLLDVDFLSLLPINPENDHPLYKAAFQKVKHTLINNSLLPTSDNRYTSATDALLSRERELTTLLNHNDCSTLFDREFWLSTAITYDKTRILKDYLTDILGIPEINMQKFCREISISFIEKKSDEWIIVFYTSSTKSKLLYRKTPSPPGILRRKPIIRLEDNSHVSPENGAGDLQVYLPSDRKSKFKTVKTSIAKDNQANEFLRSLGLVKPNDIAEIKEFIIPKYRGNNIGDDEYTEDFEKVITIWTQSDEYRKKEIIDLLKQSHFIRCKDQSGSTSFQRPNSVYFRTEKLTTWFEGNPDTSIYFIDIDTEANRKLLENLGIKYDIQLSGISEIRINDYGYYARSVNGFNQSFDIHGLRYSLENITIDRSKTLWSLILKHANKLKGHIETKTNQNYPYVKGEEKTSIAMQTLSNSSWLYNTENQLITSPLDIIVLNDLSTAYQKEDENIEKLTSALGFKLDAIKEFEEKTGMKVLSEEEFERYEAFKKEQDKDNNEQTDDDEWTPDTEPEDVDIITDESDLPVHEREDLSGQNTGGDSDESDAKNTEPNENDNDNKTKKASNNKAIGDWGESIANIYLGNKYPQEEIVWLNEKGNVGKGYDFVIRNNGNDIAYYEVKCKTDDDPQLFLISGTQWQWAQRLHDTNNGDMYKILLVSNAGKKNTTIKVIHNPVELWRKGSIFANPVSIEL